MTQQRKGLLIQANGMLQGLAYLVSPDAADALCTVSEMIDSALVFEREPNLRPLRLYSANWIESSEMLPKENEVVLVLADGKPTPKIELRGAYFIAEYSDEDGWILMGHEDWSRDVKVTHWRELPAPPRKIGEKYEQTLYYLSYGNIP